MAKRGRKAIEISRVAFQDTVTCLELEQGGAFANRSQLWAAVADSDWAKTLQPRALTAQVAMLKADALELKVNTPKGRKNTSGLTHSPQTGKRKRKIDNESITALRDASSPGLQATVNRVEGGSLRAAIKLKCIDCCCGQKKEVANCTSKSCALWNFRPYKRESDIEGYAERQKEKELYLLENAV